MIGNSAFSQIKEENLTDEFFNAAINLETAAENTAETTSATEQATQQAAQIVENIAETAATRENAVKTNMADTLKETLHAVVDKIQHAGNLISEKISALTHGNPLITKLLVISVLVLVSIAVIIVLVLIAKKFVFKKQAIQQIAPEAEDNDDEFDTSKFDDDIEPVVQDDDDDEIEVTPVSQVEETQPQSIKNEPASIKSDTIKTPKTLDEAIKNFIKITE